MGLAHAKAIRRQTHLTISDVASKYVLPVAFLPPELVLGHRELVHVARAARFGNYLEKSASS